MLARKVSPEYLCSREEESAKPEQHTIVSHGQHHDRTSKYWHQYHLLSKPENLRRHGGASSLGMISEPRNGTGRRNDIKSKSRPTALVVWPRPWPSYEKCTYYVLPTHMQYPTVLPRYFRLDEKAAVKSLGFVTDKAV